MSSPAPPPPPPSSKQPGPNFVGMNSVLKSLLENPLSLKPGADSGKDKEKSIEDEATGSNMMASAFLGPTLWDKTLPYMDNFQLEYMDLDEFLSENGIPPAPGSSAATPAALIPPQQQPQQPQQQQQQPPPTRSPLPLPPASSPPSAIPRPLPASSLQPGTVTVLLPVGGGGGGCAGGGGGGGGAGLPSAADATVVTPAGMHAEIQGRGSGQLDPPVRSPSVVDLSSRTAPPPPPPPQAAARGEPRNTPSPIDPESIEVSIGYDPDPVDLALSSVPGQEMFDPRRRKFSEEELKPQPIVKKAKKNLIPVDLRDDRYWARRRKNNVAAKRSRDARRLKENQIAVRAAFLEKENSVLRQEMAELKRDLGRFRNIVGKYEAKHGSL